MNTKNDVVIRGRHKDAPSLPSVFCVWSQVVRLERQRPCFLLVCLLGEPPTQLSHLARLHVYIYMYVCVCGVYIHMVMFRGRTAGKPLPNGPSSPFLSTYYFVGGGVWCTRTIKLKRFECIERREPRKSRILHHSSYNAQKSKIEMCDGILVAMELSRYLIIIYICLRYSQYFKNYKIIRNYKIC